MLRQPCTVVCTIEIEGTHHLGCTCVDVNPLEGGDPLPFWKYRVFFSFFNKCHWLPCLALVSSHGFGNTGGDAGYAADVEQLQSAGEREDQADAVEGHVWHRCQVEEVTWDSVPHFTSLFVLNLTSWRMQWKWKCEKIMLKHSINSDFKKWQMGWRIFEVLCDTVQHQLRCCLH